MSISYQPSHKHPHTFRRRLILIIILVAIGLVIYRMYGTQYHNPVTSKTSTAHAQATPAKPSVSQQLQSAWQTVIAGHTSSVDIAVYNHVTGQSAHYSNVGGTFNTASIVKMSILEEVLLQDQAAGQGLTTDQLAEATPMIENSDNDAASDLWTDVGGTSAMNDFFAKVGATSTTAGPGGEWGLTQTTARDQIAVVNAIAYPGALLTSDSATAADNLLDQVEADQTWGVSAGVPSGVSVELKNGWLPDSETNDAYSNTNDWTINSIGHVHGDGADYTIAVLTDGNTSEQYGIDTVEALSTATWNVLAAYRA